MNVVSDQGSFVLKKISETGPGEIVKMNYRGEMVIALCLEVSEERMVFAIIQSNIFNVPSFITTNQDTLCVSFGQQWVIEVVFGAESFPYNDGDTGDKSTQLYLTPDHLLMRLSAAGGVPEFDREDVDLRTGEIAKRVNGIPFQKWSIWANETERNRPNSRPIISFGGDGNEE